jgi:F-type H+-transporting ATPase subunit delta
MSELTTVARPYAKAAFEYALEKSAVDQWQEMLEFLALVAQNDQVKQVLLSNLSAQKKAELLNGIGAEQLDEKGQNLVKVLAENQRLDALPEVAAIFADFKAEYDKEIDVDVTAAIELDKKQQTSLTKALEKRLERKVKLNCKVDASVVAGLIIQAGDVIIDGSINTKLNRLADALQA